MSYQVNDANKEFTQRIEKCLEEKDIIGARAISEIFASQDDMYEAEQFRSLAQQWEKDNELA